MTKKNDFTARERARAIRWKATTPTLPDEARLPSPYVGKDGVPGDVDYPFCLPAEFAEYSLLPEVRELGLSLFTELGIPWHSGVGGGPTNHLLSSQVQCVNALGQMVNDPERIVRAFGPVIDIADVLEIEAGRFLTFEYIGEVDYFGESPDGPRIRGSQCTSVDAAFVVRTPSGVTELVLVEWKYTESYRRRVPEPGRDGVRRKRYRTAWAAAGSPVRCDLVALDDVFAEPLYQLVRQQLLAHAIETDPRQAPDVVRVVHVHPAANEEYQQSVHDAALLALGSTVREVWGALLRAEDRFVVQDSAAFLDPTITSAEYVARYG